MREDNDRKSGVYAFARADVTKKQTEWLKQESSPLTGLEAQALARPATPEAPLLGSRVAAFSLRPRMVVRVCVCVRAHPGVSPPHRMPVIPNEGSPT